MPLLPINGRKTDASSLQAFQKSLSKCPRFHKPPRYLEDDYTVLDQDLGAGYSGVVHKATRRDQKGGNPQQYAVKAFKWSCVPRDKRPLIETEVSIYLTMDHPHVTRLYDVYSADNDLHMVMECMEGGELFDRVSHLTAFPENSAAEAVHQMLRATNYLHENSIVHCDLKLENFLYDKVDSNHLKLIDFGFSKVWDRNTRMQQTCGTLDYMAPEAFGCCYSSQRDLWSLGVITFILLSGDMPFFGGHQEETMAQIAAGCYQMHPERWNRVSPQGQDFVKKLLVVDPDHRLTAQQALEHAWIANRNEQVHMEADSSLVEALRSFAHASRFRRCCLEMLAWSLSNEERADVRQYFIAMDKDQQGTISLVELKSYLESRFKDEVGNEEVREIFSALDNNSKESVCYSDFLAAMVSTRIRLHDDLLSSAFRRFDADNSGYISGETMRGLLGDGVGEEEVERMMAEAQVDQTEDGKISYADFVWYLRVSPDEKHTEKLVAVIDELRRQTKSYPAALRSYGVKGSCPSRKVQTFAASGRAEKVKAEKVDVSSLKIPAGALEVAAFDRSGGARKDAGIGDCGCMRGIAAALLLRSGPRGR